MTARAIILSDVHLGPAGPLSVFEDDSALAAFISKLAQEPSSTELILGGDVFDFLQCPGYVGFDQRVAEERFLSIAASHTEVFQSLATFAKRKGNEVTLLSGNHDPEVLLPVVRAAFEREISRPGTVRYEQPLCTDEEGRSLWGRGLCEDTVWVVHGDRGDSQNDIHREEILRVGGTSLPAGSHLVFQVLSKLHPTKPWVYELKPEFETVLPLLLYLDKDLTLSYLQEHYGLTLTMLRNLILSKLSPESTLGTNQPKEAHTEVAEQLASALSLGLSSLPQMQSELLLARFGRWPGPSFGSGAEPPTLASHDGVGRWLLRSWLSSVRRTERFLAQDEPDDLYQKLRSLLPSRVQVLIAGHTHGPRAILNKVPAYFNSGTWIPIGKLPDGALEQVIDNLEAGQPWTRTVPRTFVEVDIASRHVKLGRCDENGTASLA